MGRERLQWIRRFRVVVREEQVPDLIVESVVQASFALKRVSFAEGTVCEEKSNHVEMST